MKLMSVITLVLVTSFNSYAGQPFAVFCKNDSSKELAVSINSYSEEVAFLKSTSYGYETFTSPDGSKMVFNYSRVNNPQNNFVHESYGARYFNIALSVSPELMEYGFKYSAKLFFKLSTIPSFGADFNGKYSCVLND